MRKYITGAMAPALLGLCLSANAGVIDLFSTPQGPHSDLNPLAGTWVGSSVGLGDPTILGGNRDIAVDLLDNGGVVTRSTDIVVGGGLLDFSVDTVAAGTGHVDWDGPVNGDETVDPTGLGGVDLTAGGTLSEFSVQTVFSDAGFEFVFSAFTDATNFTIVSLTTTGTAVPTELVIPFSAFTTLALCGAVNPAPGVNFITCGGTNAPVGGLPADLSNLGALAIDFDPNGNSVSLDLTFDSITTGPITAVPEPGTLALLGTGFVVTASAGLRRRKKVSA